MSKHSKIIFLASAVSLIISIYVEYMRNKMHEDKNYIPICDINDFKCSRVHNSEYSKGFGLAFLPESLKISNSLYGIPFYLIMCILSFSPKLLVVEIQLFLASVSSWLSIYAAYILYFIIKDVCLFCVSLYVLNFITVVTTFRKYNALKVRKNKRS